MKSKTTFIEEQVNTVYYVQVAHGANHICRCSVVVHLSYAFATALDKF